MGPVSSAQSWSARPLHPVGCARRHHFGGVRVQIGPHTHREWHALPCGWPVTNSWSAPPSTASWISRRLYRRPTVSHGAGIAALSIFGGWGAPGATRRNLRHAD